MFRRFAAGSAIGALIIALAGLVLVFFAGLAPPRMWSVATMWCFIPFAWGIWAMLTPRAWLPERLPYWGAILGFVGGIFGAFILNLPSRVLDVSLSVVGRVVVVAAVTILYYCLWMLVRTAYRSLVVTPPREQTLSMGVKKAA